MADPINLIKTHTFISISQKDTIPPKPEDKLYSSLNLTEPEETLFLEIMGHFSLYHSSLTLYEVLCLDFFDQLQIAQGFLSKEAGETLVKEFCSLWFEIACQQDKKPEKLTTFLGKINHGFFYQKYQTTLPSTTPKDQRSIESRKNADCTYLSQNLTPRKQLLIKLLSHPENSDILYKEPVSNFFNETLKIESNSKTKYQQFLTNTGYFIRFALESAGIDVPPDLGNHWENLAMFDHLIDPKKDVQPIKDLAASLKLSSPYLHSLLMKTAQSLFQYLSLVEQIAQEKMKSPDTVSHLLGVGKVENTLPRSLEEKLNRLKSLGEIPVDFSLSSEEKNLLRSIFSIYRLSLDLTLFDHLCFALHQRMGELAKIISSQKTNDLKEKQNMLGAFWFLFYLTTARKNHKDARIGAPTIASYKHFPPFEVIISKIEELVNGLPLLASPVGLSTKKQLALKQKLQEEVKKTIATDFNPILLFLKKMLQQKEGTKLLSYGAIRFHDGPEHIERSTITTSNCHTYSQFIIDGYVFGKKQGYFGCKVSHSDLPVLPTTYSRDNLQKFAKTIQRASTKTIETFNKTNEELQEALEKKLSYANINPNNPSAKSHAEFIETILQNIITAEILSVALYDILNLAEKYIFPKEMPATDSVFCRFLDLSAIYQSGMSISFDSPPALRSIILEEITPRSLALKSYLDSSSFQEVWNFIGNDPLVQNGEFSLGRWGIVLNPLETELQDLRNDSLKQLEGLHDSILQKLRSHLKSLSLKELQEITIEKIQETFFECSLHFLLPFILVSDCLAMLQTIQYYDEETLLPAALTNLIEPDGLEILLQEIIASKTPSAPLQPSPPPQKSQQKAKKQTKVAPKIGIKDITGLTKARKILDKLAALGFFTARQNGSHFILKNNQGNTVVVPNNPQLPFGTRQSIAKQALGLQS